MNYCIPIPDSVKERIDIIFLILVLLGTFLQRVQFYTQFLYGLPFFGVLSTTSIDAGMLAMVYFKRQLIEQRRFTIMVNFGIYSTLLSGCIGSMSIGFESAYHTLLTTNSLMALNSWDFTTLLGGPLILPMALFTAADIYCSRLVKAQQQGVGSEASGTSRRQKPQKQSIIQKATAAAGFVGDLISSSVPAPGNEPVFTPPEASRPAPSENHQPQKNRVGEEPVNSGSPVEKPAPGKQEERIIEQYRPDQPPPKNSSRFISDEELYGHRGLIVVPGEIPQKKREEYSGRLPAALYAAWHRDPDVSAHELGERFGRDKAWVLDMFRQNRVDFYARRSEEKLQSDRSRAMNLVLEGRKLSGIALQLGESTEYIRNFLLSKRILKGIDDVPVARANA